MRYLGPKSNKVAAYSVASVAGVVLAVCSCSVLPMFAGIYQLGAGLGPASAFLYSGPAINVLAIFLTGRVLGFRDRPLAGAGGDRLRLRRRPRHGPDLPARGGAGRSRAAAQLPEPPPTASPAVAERAAAGRHDRASWSSATGSTPATRSCAARTAREVRGVVLQEMRDEVMIQVQESSGAVRAGDRLVLPKAEIAEIVEARELGHGRPPRALVPGRADGPRGRADDLALDRARGVPGLDGQHLGLRQAAGAAAVRRRVRRRLHLGAASRRADRACSWATTASART